MFFGILKMEQKEKEKFCKIGLISAFAVSLGMLLGTPLMSWALGFDLSTEVYVIMGLGFLGAAASGFFLYKHCKQGCCLYGACKTKPGENNQPNLNNPQNPNNQPNLQSSGHNRTF